MKKINYTDLFISVVTAELVGALSALLAGNYAIYGELIKPPFSPPAIVFPIVWIVLYAIMGISIYIVRNRDSSFRSVATGIYAIQLAINFMWSIVFFRLRLFVLSAVIAIILALIVGIMVRCFLKIDRKAGLMNIPYFIWSIFAIYLASGTALLNR